MFRKTSLILTAVGLLTLVGCADRSSARATLVDTLSGPSAALQQLDYDVAGTPQQRAAGAYVGYRTLQDGIAACLDAAGFDYPEPPFINDWMGYVSDGGADGTDFLAPLEYPSTSLALLQQRSAHRSENSLENDGLSSRTPEYYDRLKSCETATPDGDSQGHPSNYADLLASFHQMLSSIDEQLNAYSPAYVNCMASSGYSVAGYSDLLNLISNNFPPSAPPAGSIAESAPWQSGLDYEATALASDSRCRSSAYQAGMALLTPAIASFRLEHSSDLTTAKDQWAAIVQRANGYPGSPGF